MPSGWPGTLRVTHRMLPKVTLLTGEPEGLLSLGSELEGTFTF